MPKKIRFEWELPDALLDAVAQDPAKAADVIKQAAVLEWVRTHKLSVRRGAEHLQMTYRESLALMAAHSIPSIDYDEGWLEHELDVFKQPPRDTQPGRSSPVTAGHSSIWRRSTSLTFSSAIFRPS